MAKINTIKTLEEKKEKKSFIDKITGFALFLYIISTTAFENNAMTTKAATITLYLFLFLSFIYIFYKKRVTFNYYVIATICYSIFLYFSCFYTIDQGQGMRTLYSYITCAVLTIMVINYIDSDDKITLAINAYILGGLILSLFALYLYGWGIFDVARNSQFGIRIGGKLGNENSVGLSCAFSVLFSFYIMLYTKIKKRYYLYYYIVIISCTTFSLLTGSKKALFLTVLGIMLLFIFRDTGEKAPFKKLYNIALSVILLLAFIYILRNVKTFWFLNERVQELFNIIFGGGEISRSDEARFHMIKYGWEAFLHHPFIGNGVATSYYVFGTYSHNNYIELLLNTGAIGFVIYYSSYYISLRRLFRNEFKTYSFKILALIYIIASLIMENGMVVYYTRYNQILFAIISAFVSMHYVGKAEKGQYF